MYVAIGTSTMGVQHRLRGITRNIQATKPAWERVYTYLRTVYRYQFDTQGHYRGPGWAPIKESTVERKLRAGNPYPERIGHATGDLRRSLTTKGAKGNRSRVTADGLTIASAIPYAENFNKERFILRLNTADRAIIRGILRSWMSEGPYTI